MNIENQIMDAISWALARDLPDEELANAINEQARLLAGVDHDEFLESLIDIIN